MHYFIRRIIFFFLYAVYLLCRPFLCRPAVAVLMYHSISDSGWFFAVSKAEFERQIRYIKVKANPVCLSDVVDFLDGKKELPPRAVVVTFDDGYRDFSENALPILQKYNVPAILFVCGGEIDTKDLGSDSQLLTLEEIEKLSQDSLVTIGSHGLTHRKLTRLPPQMAENEIALSRVLLEKATGKTVDFFAYPKGSFNASVAGLVKKSRYRAAFTTIQRLAGAKINHYAIPRLQIDRSTSFLEFKTKLTRAADWYERIWRIVRLS
ncbi:MAG: polysaccharide deacetylase family protein [Candidatus Sungbacteria bacterium]|nr:polysaccharide deacetylase family protein [Candidatus Sungbacteria bacterium]